MDVPIWLFDRVSRCFGPSPGLLGASGVNIMSVRQIGKGDVAAQRRRRKARYRGCRICGELRVKWCGDCRAVATVLAGRPLENLALFVDGSYVTASGERARPRASRQLYAPLRHAIMREHPDWDIARVESALVEALVGFTPDDRPGHGGAGLVLATIIVGPIAGEVLATRSCAFVADNSSEAELQAVIRGARWVPGVPIYTDSESTCWAAISSNRDLDVRFLSENDRRPAHAKAHELSVEGRSRQLTQAAAASVQRSGT
jgi:hypothetical protein